LAARSAPRLVEVRFHDLRQTGVTIAVQTGATLKELMRRRLRKPRTCIKVWGFWLLRPWWGVVPTARFERATPALGSPTDGHTFAHVALTWLNVTDSP